MIWYEAQICIDEDAALAGSDIEISCYLSLTGGDTISISIAVTGDPIYFEIYDSNNSILLSEASLSPVGSNKV